MQQWVRVLKTAPSIIIMLENIVYDRKYSYHKALGLYTPLIGTPTIFFKNLIGYKYFHTKCGYHTAKKWSFYFSDRGRFWWAFTLPTEASNNHHGCAEQTSHPSSTVEWRFPWPAPSLRGISGTTEQKPLVTENYAILNKRNVLRQWIKTLETRQVLFFCDAMHPGTCRHCTLGCMSRTTQKTHLFLSV